MSEPDDESTDHRREPVAWYQPMDVDVATVGPLKVSVHLVQEKVGERIVSCDATVRLYMNSNELDPELALLLSEVLRTAGAMAKARAIRRKDEP